MSEWSTADPQVAASEQENAQEGEACLVAVRGGWSDMCSAKSDFNMLVNVQDEVSVSPSRMRGSYFPHYLQTEAPVDVGLSIHSIMITHFSPRYKHRRLYRKQRTQQPHDLAVSETYT
jgi:hypothetical protein